MTVCRYAGLNQKAKAGSLEASRVVTGAELAGFVGFSDRQEIVSGGMTSCPMAEGSVDLLEIAYATGPQVNVSVSIDGCSSASNGLRTVDGWGIGGRLAAWVGADSPPGA
jgi:hypothetical protein